MGYPTTAQAKMFKPIVPKNYTAIFRYSLREHKRAIDQLKEEIANLKSRVAQVHGHVMSRDADLNSRDAKIMESQKNIEYNRIKRGYW